MKVHLYLNPPSSVSLRATSSLFQRLLSAHSDSFQIVSYAYVYVCVHICLH